MATFRIVVQVDASGVRRGARSAENQLNKVSASADKLRQTLGRAFAFGAIAVGIRQIIALGDTFTNLQNRIRVVTDGTQQLAAVTDELFAVANRTRSAFEGTADLYARVALASRELGVNQRELLQFTESVNKAIILSGASAREANAGLIQLSQGIASGTLRGDELRSVLEQLPVVADVIAKSMGVTRGELRRLGSEGKISAETVLKAFREAREELDERFGTTIPTIGQSFNILRNNIIQLIGAIDQSNGVLRALSRAIIIVADNLDVVIRLVSTLAVVLAVNLAKQGIGAVITGLRILAVAIATNPLGVIATLITIAAAALVGFGSQLQLTAGSAATVFDFIQAGFETVVRVIKDGVAQVSGFFAQFQGSMESLDFLQLARSAAQGIDFMIAALAAGFAAGKAIAQNFPAVLGDVLISGFNRLLGVFRQLPEAISKIIQQGFAKALQSTGSFVNKIIETLNKIPGVAIDVIGVMVETFEDIENDGALTNPFEGALADVGSAANVEFARVQGLKLAGGLVDGFAERAEELAGERAIKALKDARDRAAALAALDDPAGPAAIRLDPDFENIIAKLTREQASLTKTLGLSNEELVVEQGLLKIANRLKRELTDTEMGRARALLEENQQLLVQRDVLQSIQGPLDSIVQRQTALRQLFDQGAISAKQFAEEMRNLNVEATALDNSISGGLLNGLARIAQEANNVGASISDFVVDSFNKATDSIVEFAKTGQFNLRQFFQDLFANLAKLALNQFFGQLIGGLFGGGGGGLLGGLFGGLPGFATGGSFEVGAGTSLATTPGQDNRVVGFRARDGETVTVSRPGESPSSGGGGTRVNNVTFNISSPDVEGFRQSQNQILAKTRSALDRANRRDN